MIKIGEKYNFLEVIGESKRAKSGHKQFLCRCICGVEKIINSYNVEKGRTKSCGCQQIDLVTKHGKTKTPEYRTWQAMKRRCYNPNIIGYKNYGGRGINVCVRWHEFELFLSDMGERPSDDHSIERLDNNGNYTPGNCVWATNDDQVRNRRSSVKIEVNGTTKVQIDWSRELGFSDSTIKMRIRRGMSPEEAVKITEPINKPKPFSVYKKDTMEFIGVWDTKVNCANDLGFSDKHIGSVLNGNRKSTNGYIMSYDKNIGGI